MPGAVVAQSLITITFVQPDGGEQVVTAPCGDSLMDAALDNGVRGIVAQCGGGCTCCTCHCWLRTPWDEAAAPPHADELELLAYAPGRADNSRLACQVELAQNLDGMVVDVPAEQN